MISVNLKIFENFPCNFNCSRIEYYQIEKTTMTTTTENKINVSRIDANDNQPLIDFIASLGNSSTFISLLTVTEPTMVKKHRETKVPNPYLGKVVKFSQYSFHLNADYKKKVEKNIQKETGIETNYSVKENYFDHIDICKSIVVNKKNPNKKYIAGIVNSVSSKYFLIDDNGKYQPIKKELIKPYLPVKPKQEFKPEFRTISLENIVRIKRKDKQIKY